MITVAATVVGSLAFAFILALTIIAFSSFVLVMSEYMSVFAIVEAKRLFFVIYERLVEPVSLLQIRSLCFFAAAALLGM